MPFDQLSSGSDLQRQPDQRASGDGKPTLKATKIQYILTGFTHDVGFRVFAFECIGEDRIRTAYSVRADLALTRKYGIRVQELPLLCRSVLEQRDASDTEHAFTYTEAAMCLRANVRAAEAAEQKRKPPRRPPSERVGAAWRGPQV